MANQEERLRAIQQALAAFDDTQKSLTAMSTNLLEALGYRSDKQLQLGELPETLIQAFDSENRFRRDKAQFHRWQRAAFLFQLTNDEIPSLLSSQGTLIADHAVRQSLIESFVFLSIELEAGEWSRTDLATITREVNRLLPMPAIMVFKYGKRISLAVIDRRPNKLTPSRDVIDKTKISIVKDINYETPHRAHCEILSELAIDQLSEKRQPSSFRELYEAWMLVLSIEKLNEKFYQELAWWYLYAVKCVHFPKGGGLDEEQRKAISVIRLLTRVIFIWFIKEQGLVPEEFFTQDKLKTILKDAPDKHPDSSNYYQAILQNLFFATLNSEKIEERRWRRDNKGGGLNSDYLNHKSFRYKRAFIDPNKAMDLFKKAPFLNGGLFECLDRKVSDKELERDESLAELISSTEKNVLRIDGFSERAEAQPHVPNKLFFYQTTQVDLNKEMHTTGKKQSFSGLIDLFNKYKFTVEENTPVEEEVALDPELLGKVFENLLASYNVETREIARKKSGSFYTPRYVVDYMVDEVLLTYFKTAVSWPDGATNEKVETLENRLRDLLAYGDLGHRFNELEVDRLITAIEQMKTLDPACGSGAYPMGILQKMVHILKKLDPGNHLWRLRNRIPLKQQQVEAESIPDPVSRSARVEEAEEALKKFDHAFSNVNYPDYSRKLYLIEKCIYGIDIQPIAVQIAKLRFFIALVISQRFDQNQPNFNITPLPNLETKIVAADSLRMIRIGEQQEDQQYILRYPAVIAKEEKLRSANNRYFAASTAATKAKHRDTIFQLREELIEILLDDQSLLEGTARQLALWDPFNQNTFANFFDTEWMFGFNGGFNIVIGNPPYVRQERIDKSFKAYAKENYKCFSGTADLYIYFYERSIKLLRSGGAFAFITSNKWYRSKYGEKLRDWMNRNTILKSIIDFGDADVFDAIAYPTIVIATRRLESTKSSEASNELSAYNWPPESKDTISSFPQISRLNAFSISQSELKRAGWQLEPPLKRRLLERIRATGVPLGQWCEGRFYYGIKTGYNEAFIIDAPKRGRLISEDPRSSEIIKPFLRGRDVKRWQVNFSDEYLIKIESSENKKHPWTSNPPTTAEQIFADTYPAIHAHFSSQEHRRKLISRRDQGRYFWELRSCSYWEEFEQQKIILGVFMDKPTYAFDDQSYCHNNALYFISRVSPHLTAILNSSVCWWFLTNTSTDLQNGFLQALKQNQYSIPIPYGDNSQILHLNTLVKLVGLLSRSYSDNVVHIGILERLMNGLTYELCFPEELHARGIRIFSAMEEAGILVLAKLQGQQLQEAAQEWANQIFSPSHPIYGMLFDLQSLDVVRIIEGHE